MTNTIIGYSLPVMGKKFETTLLQTPSGKYWGWVAYHAGRGTWHFSRSPFGAADARSGAVASGDDASAIFAAIEDPNVADVANRVFEAAMDGGATIGKAWDMACQVPTVRQAVDPGGYDWRQAVQAIVERRGWTLTDLHSEFRRRGHSLSYPTIHGWLKGVDPRPAYREEIMRMLEE